MMYISKYAIGVIYVTVSVLLLTQLTSCNVISQPTTTVAEDPNYDPENGARINANFTTQLFNFTYFTYADILKDTINGIPSHDPNYERALSFANAAKNEFDQHFFSELQLFEKNKYTIAYFTLLSDVMHILNGYNSTADEIRDSRTFYIKHILRKNQLDVFDENIDQKLETFVNDFKQKSWDILNSLTRAELSNSVNYCLARQGNDGKNSDF